jgi:cyclohexa-1,5-dienecarbonyl-CoA hydratase
MSTSTAIKFERLAVDIQPPVASITLSHPPLNVIDILMMEELVGALVEIETRNEISVIVLGGAGKGFSAGVDVAAHAPEKVRAMLERFHGVIRALVATRKVTIAAVDGHCLGGGAELAMVCDLVYTADDATWGFPEIQLGCFPPVAATALASLIGQKRAADLILTGRTLGGEEAARIGLANEAVPQDQLIPVVRDRKNRLTALSSAALRITKKAVCAWDSIDFDKGLKRAEKIYFEELMNTQDVQEGIRAFLEKRSPQWKNR